MLLSDSPRLKQELRRLDATVLCLNEATLSAIEYALPSHQKARALKHPILTTLMALPGTSCRIPSSEKITSFRSGETGLIHCLPPVRLLCDALL